MGLRHREHHFPYIDQEVGSYSVTSSVPLGILFISPSLSQRTGLDSDHLTLSLLPNLWLSRAIPLLSWKSILNKERAHKGVDNNDINEHKTPCNLHYFKIISASEKETSLPSSSRFWAYLRKTKAKSNHPYDETSSPLPDTSSVCLPVCFKDDQSKLMKQKIMGKEQRSEASAGEVSGH